MQNRGLIIFFAIAFALVCLFELSFTFFSKNVENKASKFADGYQTTQLAENLSNGDKIKEGFLFDSISKKRKEYYLDSVANKTAFNALVRKYTYQECKERELNLGLDLKGGMNVMLEVSVIDVIKAMCGNQNDPVFKKAVENAIERQKSSNTDIVTLFAEEFHKADPNAQLAALFSTFELQDQVKPNSTNDEVIAVIKKETEDAFDRTLNILRTRIDKFGVAQPSIQALASSNRILVELPGVKDPARVRKLLQGTANLEFWETYKFNEISNYFSEANEKLRSMGVVLQDDEDGAEAEEENPESSDSGTDEIIAADENNESLDVDTSTSLLEDVEESTSEDTEDSQQQSFDEFKKNNPLFAYLSPAVYNDGGQQFAGQTATVGYVLNKDKDYVMSLLEKVKNVFPRDVKFVWDVKPEKDNKGKETDTYALIALKVTTRDGKPALDGRAIVNARQDYDQNGNVEINMTMNPEGAKTWKRLTGENIERQIAIVLDNYVYSAPNVISEISGGVSQITGNFTIAEAKDMANILKAGKLPAPARIVQEEVVGPSLGKEAVSSGLNSIIIAFIMVLLFMVFYYNRAGLVSNIALISNIFFLFGVLASLGAVLTLPGIAGIVLTLGMAVDANVIIYERIKEEIRTGKGLRLAIADGYKNAYSAIIDGNITTLLTGIVLLIFGSGPVKGFATTLIIGIISSLFTSIFVSRLIFRWLLNNDKKVNFGNKWTINAFTNLNIDFISKRKTFYIVSATAIIIGIASLTFKGLNYGVDFSGGRTYVVRFDENVNTVDIRNSLAGVFDGDAPEVKTFGPTRQVKITTKYLIDDNSSTVDSLIESKLYDGVKDFYTSQITEEQFLSDSEDKLVGKLSSQKVGPTIADDLLTKSYFALVFALIIIFIYIAARFKKWQYGLGGVATLIHDSLIAISMYSIFNGILPFNMEVDQAFIAAILTIIGYSINDTVIIFDRIREYTNKFPKRLLNDNINGAINSTLGRTFMTSGTTLLVLLVIFIFGGEIIRGFSFALIVGVIVGTYSSIFISTPIAYDLTPESQKKPYVSKKDMKRKQKSKRA